MNAGLVGYDHCGRCGQQGAGNIPPVQDDDAIICHAKAGGTKRERKIHAQLPHRGGEESIVLGVSFIVSKALIMALDLFSFLVPHLMRIFGPHASNEKALQSKCYGRYWHLASFAACPRFGRYWTSSGHWATLALNG
jgi:hypothetical protein